MMVYIVGVEMYWRSRKRVQFLIPENADFAHVVVDEGGGTDGFAQLKAPGAETQSPL